MADSTPPPLSVHVPILLEPIVQCLTERLKAIGEEYATLPGQRLWIVDCTLGGGGHTEGFLSVIRADPELAERVSVLAIDQDEGAVLRARLRFSSDLQEGRLEIHQGRFSEIGELVAGRLCFGLLADFGFSSDQIEDPERGLSFRADGPLDMRLDTSRGESARAWLMRARESEIEEVLREYGEERYSKRIAAAIVENRRRGGIGETAREFGNFVSGLVPHSFRQSRIHPATRVFQAIRIQVNDELGEIDRLLGDVLPRLQPRARIALISFHSLEDRKVKITFKDREGLFHSLTKKPIEADDEEVKRNPRSRSAKLRLAEKR